MAMPISGHTIGREAGETGRPGDRRRTGSEDFMALSIGGDTVSDRGTESGSLGSRSWGTGTWAMPDVASSVGRCADFRFVDIDTANDVRESEEDDQGFELHFESELLVE